MKFEINILLHVDPEANFLETFGDNTDVIAELVRNYLYDIDDTTVLDCEVKNDE
jgi:hypothetical protein|tara:strand:- start:553 stop:714 length:162 start_codon:yes stop_codon:yes gene_type:complete